MQKLNAALIGLSMLALLAYSASASSVTLTASCSNINIRNNSAYINFTISNTGDGNATNVVLTAAQSGVLSSTVNHISVFYPGNKSTVSFMVEKPSHYGNYGFGVNVAYTQAQQTFIVSFPCEVSYVNNSVSLLAINNLSENNDVITAHITNMGNFPINATEYFIAPPYLNISGSAAHISVQPGSTYTLQSKIRYNSVNVTLPVALVLSYVKDNISYTSMSTTRFSLSKNGEMQSLTILFFIGIIAVIVALIAISLLVNRKKKAKTLETD